MDAYKKDQAPVMDIRKKDMINNINIIMIFVMIETLDWRPGIPGFYFKQFPELAGRGMSRTQIELAADEASELVTTLYFQCIPIICSTIQSE